MSIFVIKTDGDCKFYESKEFENLSNEDYCLISGIILLNDICIRGKGNIIFSNLKNFIDNGYVLRWTGSLRNMFRDRIIPDISSWDISKVVDTSYMFVDCSIRVDLSDWDVSNIKHSRNMFKSCSIMFDISKWNLRSIIDSSGMFEDVNMFHLDVSKWNLNDIEYTNNMFKNSRYVDENTQGIYYNVLNFNESVEFDVNIEDKFKERMKYFPC